MRPCDVETPEDFRRYYAGAWLGLTDSAGVIPVGAYNETSKDGKSVYIYRMLPGPIVSQEIEKWDWEEFKKRGVFGRPVLGMVQNKATIVFGANVAERNSRRGLLLSRMSFYEFNNWDLRHKYRQDPPNDHRYDIIWNYFNPHYVPFTEAFHRLDEGETAGVVLSPNYALYTSSNSSHPCLAYKRWPVGYAERFQVFIHRRFREYQDEVRDLCRVDVHIV